MGNPLQWLGNEISSGVGQLGKDIMNPTGYNPTAMNQQITDTINNQYQNIVDAINKSYKQGVTTAQEQNQGGIKSEEAGQQAQLGGMGLGFSPIAAAMSRKYASEANRNLSSQVAQLGLAQTQAMTQAAQQKATEMLGEQQQERGIGQQWAMGENQASGDLLSNLMNMAGTMMGSAVKNGTAVSTSTTQPATGTAPATAPVAASSGGAIGGLFSLLGTGASALAGLLL